MALGRTALKGGLAALMVVVMTAGAFAWEAVATTSVNVRSGPGTQFRVIDVLSRNQVVNVDSCRSGWCYVETNRHGRTGWVSQNYLRQTGGWQQPPRPQPPVYQPPRPQPPVYQPPRPQPPHWNPAPPRPPHWNPNPRPPHWNPAPPRPQPPRPAPPPRGEVCFSGPNGYFCVGN